MNRIFKCLLFSFVFIALNVHAQQTYTISGTIKDAYSGETIIGVNILIGNGQVNTVTNDYGFYSLSLPSDSIRLTINYIGYQPIIKNFLLSQDTTIDIQLTSLDALQDVVVSANSIQEKLTSTEIGVEEVTAKQAKEIAAMFGEVDLIKVLQLKPGVQSGLEGSSGLYIRGGGPDQNHFLLDEAPIYNPSHLLGLFSTFNADITKNVKLFKAGFPAQYGGKLSSVVDVRTREGNRKDYHITGGLGLIAARLAVEGPLKKDKGAFIVSGRRTYADLFTGIMNEANKDNPNWFKIPSYNFYDINAKLNYDLSSKDRIFFSGYFGRDAFYFEKDPIRFNLNWGNIAGTLRWNRTISPKLFVNTSLTFSDYFYQIKSSYTAIDLELTSGIRDINLKTDFTWSPSNRHLVKFGGNAIYHQFKVGQFNADANNVQLTTGSNFHAGEFAVHIADDWSISPKVKLLTGLRLSGFYNDQKFYANIEPRLAIRYMVHPRVALKASYARMSQYLHLIATSGATLPTNIWYPSNKTVTPQLSDLVSASVSCALGKDFYISIEGYYKWLHQQVDFRDGAKLFINDEMDKEFIFGRGYSYGAEVYIEKKHGALRGWIGYTLSWTWRQFDAVNNGIPYHPRHDRRHDISAVLIWDIPWTKPKFPLTLSASWVYGTGNAVSLPSKRYIQMDLTGTNPFHFMPVYTKRGGFILPAYHRLDLGLVWHLFPLSKKRLKSNITFSVYNVYDRRNPFFMYIDAVYPGGGSGANNTQLPEKFQAKIVSLFPVIPSITWNFKW